MAFTMAHHLRKTNSALIKNLSSVRDKSTASTIGFIGLGNMGAHMCRSLIQKGHTLTIYDVQSAAAAKFEKLGVTIATTPAELAARSNKILTMLPASAHVRSAYTGSDGILQGVKPGTLIADCSTIDPEVSKEMAVASKQRSARFLDSPVSGGVMAAKAGTLTFMVGGPKVDFEELQPLLLDMGAKVVHCGGAGAGQAAKICNNMLLAISMIGTAETMNLGIRMGLDPKLLASILNSSSGRCWSSEMYNPVPGVTENVPAGNNYQGGFGTALMTKDLGLAQHAASTTATATPLGALSYQIYRMMCSQGMASKDFSAVFKFFQDTASSSGDNSNGNGSI